MEYIDNFNLQKLIGRDVDNTIKEQILSRVYDKFSGHKYLIQSLYAKLSRFPERPASKEDEKEDTIYLDELLDIPLKRLMEILLTEREYNSFLIDEYFQ